MNLNVIPVVKDEPRPLTVSAVLAEYDTKWADYVLVGTVMMQGKLHPLEYRLDGGWHLIGGPHGEEAHFTMSEVTVVGLVSLYALANYFQSKVNPCQVS